MPHIALFQQTERRLGLPGSSGRVFFHCFLALFSFAVPIVSVFVCAFVCIWIWTVFVCVRPRVCFLETGSLLNRLQKLIPPSLRFDRLMCCVIAPPRHNLHRPMLDHFSQSFGFDFMCAPQPRSCGQPPGCAPVRLGVMIWAAEELLVSTITSAGGDYLWSFKWTDAHSSFVIGSHKDVSGHCLDYSALHDTAPVYGCIPLAAGVIC